ncbi:hypothetical protein LY78DRAFT_202554 [Colletotrichum sublineola]|nr:hypothetical protein LY78DRAFT_202554 [Colletotrichum sublineola]
MLQDPPFSIYSSLVKFDEFDGPDPPVPPPPLVWVQNIAVIYLLLRWNLYRLCIMEMLCTLGRLCILTRCYRLGLMCFEVSLYL